MHQTRPPFFVAGSLAFSSRCPILRPTGDKRRSTHASSPPPSVQLTTPRQSGHTPPGAPLDGPPHSPTPGPHPTPVLPRGPHPPSYICHPHSRASLITVVYLPPSLSLSKTV
ncbi:hypothetical protein DAI22_09g112850 [Oryza sativa Japonica Group]|nr:hypothetical protein DAI22_09g112850 [Oryza sativa Japonica Group]